MPDASIALLKVPRALKPADFKLLISQKQIDTYVEELASRINSDYAHASSLVLIGVLKGAVIFLADLMRHLKMPVEVDFVRLSSYKGGVESTGTVSLQKDIEVDISGREVIVIEEIVDSGRTLDFLYRRLLAAEPKSLRVCALLNKPIRRVIDVPLHYIGTNVGNYFLVGYGLDYKENYRNLPGIYYIE